MRLLARTMKLTEDRPLHNLREGLTWQLFSSSSFFCAEADVAGAERSCAIQAPAHARRCSRPRNALSNPATSSFRFYCLNNSSVLTTDRLACFTLNRRAALPLRQLARDLLLRKELLEFSFN